jgi:hypothetical protein
MMKNKSFIKEICIKLNFRIEMSNDVLTYVEMFQNSQTHNFSSEVIICTCIYLSSKINEDFKRIRDIINVFYFVKNKYEKITKGEGGSNKNKKEEKEYIMRLAQDDYMNEDGKALLVKTMYELTLDNVW